MSQISTHSPQHSKDFFRKVGPVLKNSMDDLFQRVVLHDDGKAFETIFHRMHASLCRLSCRVVHDTELAEELVDDVFCHFWRNRKNINITSSFSSYLLVSVRNRSLDCLRRVKHHQRATLESAAQTACAISLADDQMAFVELTKRVDSAIQSLPGQCRLIFTMSRDHDLSYREIAEKLSLSIKTVDTQMGRALKQLRAHAATWDD